MYAKDGATVGIGAGQMSRVDAARIAVRKAEDAAKELGLAVPLTQGSVVASDAFFPFADGLLVAIEAGATAVIQPGGSLRDNEVIQAADDNGIAMVFTGVPAFPALNRGEGSALVSARAPCGPRPRCARSARDRSARRRVSSASVTAGVG